MDHPHQLDPDQQLAIELMLAGRNVFLSGRAGSGKSTVVEHFRELCPRNAAFLAPTGLAALNIGGCTVHRFLRFPAAFIPADHVPLRFTAPDLEAIMATETIIVDEISMVRADLFQAMANTLSALPLRGRAGRPFGGRQMVVVGDFCQLPPVVSTWTEEFELHRSFGGIFSFDATAWRAASFETVWLGQAHRQGSERDFADALDGVRLGRADYQRAAEAVTWINRNARITRQPEECTILCPVRRKVAETNARRDARLGSTIHAFEATISGAYNVDDCPADRRLELRVGSRVMVLANSDDGDQIPHANGDTGRVVSIDPERPAIDVRLDDGREITVGRHRWLEQEYRVVEDPDTGNRELKLITIGAMQQIPLKLAYAATIHKAQGMTIARVHLDLSCGIFASGQLYVALSRCPSLAGLSLERAVSPWDAFLDPRVRQFQRRVGAEGSTCRPTPV
jgi:ATP-dependent exoDNAse (exonuclease V) alpha subunit